MALNTLISLPTPLSGGGMYDIIAINIVCGKILDVCMYVNID